MSRLQRACRASAYYHAGGAVVAEEWAAFDESGEWQGVGFRTCAHFMSVRSRHGLWESHEFIRVGHAMKACPRLAAAFRAARLSFDQMRWVTSVATAADEHIWLDIALTATAPQLKRICREFRRCTVIDDPARNEMQQAERSLATWWRSDGMLQIVASLPPAEGEVVRRAIENALAPPESRGVGVGKHPAADTYAARRADALVKICSRWLSAAAEEQPLERAPRELVVHVDVETLLGEGDEGRCHLEDGPAVAAALARRVGCESTLVVSLERGGVPLNLVSQGRVVSGRLRRALQLRDGTCRFPGCTVSARDSEGHHLWHHLDGGPTELWNLISLCEFHHHRHHEGEFTIRTREDGSFEFVDAYGSLIGPPAELPRFDRDVSPIWPFQLEHSIDNELDETTAGPIGGGEAFDLGFAVSVISDHVESARARAGPRLN